jgi:hypothetical protein
MAIGNADKGNYVLLEGQYVYVYIKPSETARAAVLDKGQTVTLIGTCSGYRGFLGVEIINATFSI